MTDLRRDLLQTDDVPLMRVTTDDPNPSYIRIAALNRFSDNEWSTGNRDIPVENRADGAVPLPEIDRSVPRTQYDYEVTGLSEFQSTWLPTQSVISQISAGGDWRYDVETLDFLAADDDLDTSGLTYTFTSVALDLDSQMLADAASAAGEVDSSYRDLPTDLPTLVDNLALEVTRDYPSRYEKAVALQDWFRKDGGFEYSLDNVPPGNGPDELTAFLTEGPNGRTGYCEQFASAMAAMARALGIPARVAVGFLDGEQVAPGTYEFSSDDMHAWPELYFNGAGWVRFEPTPSDRAADVPSYTTQNLPQLPEPESSDGASQSAGQQPSPGQDPRLDEGVLPEEQSPRAQRGFPWVPVLGGVAGVLVLVLLLLLPSTVRRRQGVRRLTGSPEPAWAELEATARDLGVPWPSGRSPRQTRDRLVDQLGSDPSRRPGRATPPRRRGLTRRRGRARPAGALARAAALLPRAGRRRCGGRGRRHPDRAERAPRRGRRTGPATGPLVAGVGAAVAAPAGGGRHRPGRGGQPRLGRGPRRLTDPIGGAAPGRPARRVGPAGRGGGLEAAALLASAPALLHALHEGAAAGARRTTGLAAAATALDDGEPTLLAGRLGGRLLLGAGGALPAQGGQAQGGGGQHHQEADDPHGDQVGDHARHHHRDADDEADAGQDRAAAGQAAQ